MKKYSVIDIEPEIHSRKPRNFQTRDAILRYMISFSRETGKQPSVREIGAAAGLMSTSTTAGYLQRMMREGLLEKSGEARRPYSVNPIVIAQMSKAG